MKDLEFVITVPEEKSTEICIKTDARQTVAVLIDIFLAAKKYVILSAPYLQDFPISNPNLELAIQTALARGVQLIIVSTGKSIGYIDLKRLGKNLKVYQPKENLKDEKTIGSHAKFCLADGEIVYIGSANFTVPGLGKHVEMGVLGTKSLAKKVEKFWYYLYQYGFLIEVKL